MHPLVLDFGSWQVTSYGLALTLAFAFGIALGFVRAGRHGLMPEPVLGVSIVIVVSSIVGSRLFFAWSSPPDSVSGGVVGLSVMGGFPAALLCAWLYLRLRGLPILAYMDVLAPSVAFGAGITRVGCFFNGCCHGVACDWPWAVRFPVGSLPDAHLGAISVHPTQLYQSLAGFVIGFALIGLARRRPAPGLVVSALVLAWGLQRSAAELFRYSAGGEIWFTAGEWNVSVYQGVALALVVIGLAGCSASKKVWTRTGEI